MRSIAWLAPLLAVIGCASSAAAPPPSSSPTPASTTGPTAAVNPNDALTRRDGRLLIAGVEIHQTTDEFRGAEVAGSAEKLWTSLPAVYDQLGLPVSGLDTEKRAVAATNVRAIGQLNRMRASRYIDCGSAGPLGGNAADTYELTINIATQVLPISSTRAKVVTLVQSYGRSPQSSNDPIHCTSKGLLEARVAELVAVRAAQ